MILLLAWLFPRAVEDTRGKILAHIEEASSYQKCLNPNMVNNLLDQMKWIENELNLSSISINSDDHEYFTSLKNHIRVRDERHLTGRQMHCYLYCMDLINQKEYSKAYHELFDFIHDYGRKDKLPLSDFEVKGLKLLVEAMKRGVSILEAT